MFHSAIPELALPGYPRSIFCLDRSEARHVHDNDVPAYFRYGIWVRPGDVVFDVGANIGLFTLAALARSDERATVYAFEPVPSIRHVLSLNTARFADGRVKVLPFGLSRQRGVLRFTHLPRLPGRSFTYLDAAESRQARAKFEASLLADIDDGRVLPWLRRLPRPLRGLAGGIVARIAAADTVYCEARTLSEAMQELGVERIDLLKVNVEGAELDVLDGIADDDWRRIRKIVLELDHFSSRTADTVARLEARGYSRVIAAQTEDARRPGDVGLIYAVAASAAARP